MPSIVIDLDGTLSDCSGRVHPLQNGDWVSFHSELMNDEPMSDVRWFLENFGCGAFGPSPDEFVETIVCTGRSEKYREQTLRWFADHDIFVDHLLMRPDNDYMPDHELKPKMLEEFFGSREKALEEVKFVIDDRDAVVEAWRNYGLPCWQCRSGGY